jgi:hypothetical protein
MGATRRQRAQKLGLREAERCSGIETCLPPGSASACSPIGPDKARATHAARPPKSAALIPCPWPGAAR